MRVSQPPYRAVPHRTALNRSVPNRTELCVRCAISGTLEVRSKFAQGTVRVRYGCGTGAVRYFNFFMTDTVGEGEGGGGCVCLCS